MSSRFFRLDKPKLRITILLLVLTLTVLIVSTKATDLSVLKDILTYPIFFLMSLLVLEEVSTASYITSFLIWLLFFLLEVIYLYILGTILITLYTQLKPKKNGTKSRKKKIKKR